MLWVPLPLPTYVERTQTQTNRPTRPGAVNARGRWWPLWSFSTHRQRYCFKGVGGTASSVVYHCSFCYLAQRKELAPEAERCGRNVLWEAKLLAVPPGGVVLGAGWREWREKWEYLFF